MKLKKTIKRVVALGIGATMMGATILGATAAADLADYPSPFIKDGKFDGKIVVGNDAKVDDVVGSIDIATSLQYASTTASSSTGGTVTNFVGDAWKVGTGSKKLEMSEKLDSTASPVIENVANITASITGTDLNALAEGTVNSDKGTATYSQYLHWENKWSGATVANVVGSEYVMFLESSTDDVLADYFYIANTHQIAKYELSFKTSWQTDVEDSAGTSDTTGVYLGDYEGKILNVIGMDYEVVKARRTAVTSTPNSAVLTLMGGAVKTVMEEGATKTFKINGKDYAVTVSGITDVAPIVAKFSINGESTKSISEGNSDTLSDGTEIGITDIMPNEAGDPTGDIVEFYLGASKILLKDTDVTNVASSNKLEVGNEKIDDAAVIITGTNDNSTFSIDSIQVNISADDDYYVPVGGKLSALMEEPQALMNWDIEYKGLTTETTEQIRVKTSGSDQYDLEFVDGDGYKATVPIAYTSGGTALLFGDDDDSLIIQENISATRNDYIIVTDGTQKAGERNTYALRYRGADKQTNDNPVVKFDNLGDGKSIEKSHKLDATSGMRKATLNLGGTSFNVWNATGTLTDNFAVFVDLDGDGDSPTADGNNFVGVDKVKITSHNGAEIELQNSTAQGNVTVTIATVDVNDYETLAPSQLSFYASSTGGEVRLTENGTASFKAPEDDRYVQYTYTSMGGKVTLTNPTSDPQELTVDYPSEQRTPEVFVTSGKVSYASAGGSTESVTIQKIEVGAAVLASEISDVTADNLIIVGGPCANEKAREIMGVTLDNCAQDFEEGKAKIKLYEQSTGKVAILVAGYSAMDTRRATRVLANYADYALSGSEVEISGTSLSDITVSKVA